MNFSRLGYYYQQQALAVPEDATADPLLTRWAKPREVNPLPGMQLPPGGNHAQVTRSGVSHALDWVT